MTNFHNWTGDEEIAEQVPQFLNDDNAATLEKLDTKFNNSLKITGAADLNSFKDEGLYYCNSNSQAETILNCPTNYAFGLMVWGKEDILYQEVREFNRGSNQDYNNCWRRSYYSEGGQGVWSNWQQMSYVATTLAGYGITDGMSKTAQNSVSTENIMKRNVNNSSLRLMGGINVGSGASLQLCGSALTGTEGHFSLMAVDSAQSATLKGSPSGLLKWNNKNIVRSINNVAADENGNVNIVVSGGGSGGGSNITVDAELSATSTNPVQNKVIKGALDDKANLNKNNTFSKENYFQKGMSLIAYRDLDSAIKWYQSPVNPPIASIDATNYTGTAAKATSDGAGNVITETYAKKTDVSGVVKSVNGTKPDASGNVTVAVSGGGGVSTSESNTWTAQQNFHDLMLNREKYTTYVVNSTSDTPVTSTMVYAVTGAFTLNLVTLAGALSASQSSVFTAYFAANADYSLTISNAGKLKYVGSASDIAITSAGLLLNIWMSKDGGGTLTSIVQASKLS